MIHKALSESLLFLAVGIAWSGECSGYPVPSEDHSRIGGRNRLPSNTVVRLKKSDGMRVVLVEDRRFPVTLTKLIIRGAGPMHLADYPSGMSRLVVEAVPSALVRGVPLSMVLEEFGADISVAEDRSSDSAVVQISCLQEDIHQAVSALFEAVAHPLSGAQFDVLRSKFSTVRRNRESVPLQVAEKNLFTLLEPLTAGPSASEDVPELTVQLANAWAEERYKPDRMVLGIIGDVRTKSLARFLQSHSLGLTSTHGRVPQVSAALTAARQDRLILVGRPRSTQVSIAIGAHFVGRDSQDFLKMLLWTRVLGHAPKSRLRTVLREKAGATYDVSSSLLPNSKESWWTLYASLNREKSTYAISEIFRQILLLQRDPISKAELDGFKDDLLSEFALSLEVPENRLGYVLDKELYGLEWSYWQAYSGRILTITPESILEAARRNFDRSRLRAVIVGDPSDLVAAQAVLADELGLAPP